MAFKTVTSAEKIPSRVKTNKAIRSNDCSLWSSKNVGSVIIAVK